MSSRRELYYSATIITLDGSDTTAYGEPCEPGKGYSEQSGHWDPDYSYWQVHESRDQVQPDVYPEQSGQTPAQWAADQLRTRLGSVDSYDHGNTFYAAQEEVYLGTLAEVQGSALTAAGHAYGFTDDELADIAVLLGFDEPDDEP